MITPYVVRRLNGGVPAPLVIGAHAAALTLGWLGVLDLVVASAGLAHSMAAFCEMALDDRPLGGDGGDMQAVLLPVTVGALMIAQGGVRFVTDRCRDAANQA